MVPSRNDATDSVLGFLYQGQYALLLLWDAGDDDAVSVETEDDVVLEGNTVTLNQLKHSRGTPPDLRITNAGFWKTLRIWSDHIRTQVHAVGAETSPGSSGTRYCFVTVGRVSSNDTLALICEGTARDAGTDSAVAEALTQEAERVQSARAAARADGTPEPHADRAGGCAAFLSLSAQDRVRLVGRITILDRQFRITDVADRVAHRLRSSVRREHREAVTERLIAWWDRQVALALMSRRPRRINKVELTGAIQDFIAETRWTTLPDDFSWRSPEDRELAEERGGNIERQVQLVRGGNSRVERALLARWRARAQRSKWTEYDVSIAPDLQQFDERLKEAWAERHGPLRDDCVGLGDDEVCQRGLAMLEWAHIEVPQQVPPPRPEWNRPFYAQGMLQQFAEELEVGWHPDYRALLASDEPDAAPESGSDTSAEQVPGRAHARGAHAEPRSRRTRTTSSNRSGPGRKNSPAQGESP